MNHDTTHCKGEYCEIRMKCMRFAAHLEAVEMKFKFPLNYIGAKTCIDRGHKLFVRGKSEN